jgi:hypothetical protein
VCSEELHNQQVQPLATSILVTFLRSVSASNRGTMDVQLTDRLLNLNYKDEPDVTRNSQHECLFLCFVQYVKTWESRPKHVENVEESVLLHYPSHSTRPLNEREKLDVGTSTGMRLLAADKGESMLDPATPHPYTALLKKHIMHRFRSAYMRDRDAEVLGEAVLPDDAPEADKLDAWCKLMRTTGTPLRLFTALRHPVETPTMQIFSVSCYRVGRHCYRSCAERGPRY